LTSYKVKRKESITILILYLVSDLTVKKLLHVGGWKVDCASKGYRRIKPRGKRKNQGPSKQRI